MSNLPFPLRSDPGPITFMGEPRLMNCFPEALGNDKRAPVGFLAIPGQKAFATVSGVPSRGGIELPELSAAYSVHGQTVYKIASDGTSSALSGMLPGLKPVVIERGPQRFMQSEVTISIASPGVVTWQNHRLPANATIQLSTDGDLPTGLLANVTYYVRATGLTQNAFQLSATSGGSAINATGTQDGTHTATRTTPTYQVGIVSDSAVYCIEDDNLIFVEWLPTAEAANSITMLANRWILSYPSGKNFYSELNDLLSGSLLNFFTAEARPDGMVRAMAAGGDVVLLGTETGEVYTPSGNADNPFTPLSGTFIQKGCGSRDSVTIFDNTLHWIGNDGIVYRLSGYTPQRVSTHAVERAIAVVDKTTVKAFVDLAKGHSFLVLTSDSWTWVYDAATQFWCERSSYQRKDWNAFPYLSAFGKRLVGDKQNGVFSELSDAYFDENGSPVRVEMIFPDIPGPMIFNRIEFDLAAGAGLGGVVSTTNGYDPKIMLSWSDDGGHRWSNERIKAIGVQGDWDARICFYALGMARTARGRRFKLAMSDPVRKAFMLGDIQAQQVAA